MFVKLCIWILFPLSVWAYDPTVQEEMALNTIFGPQIAADIAASVVVGEDSHGRGEYFSSFLDEIRVDSGNIGYFRDNLMIVHEGMHWYQKNVLHHRLVWMSDEKDYHIDWNNLYSQMGQEQEAEAARLYGLWVTGSAAAREVDTNLTDSKESRDLILAYLSRFCGL